MYQNPVKRPVKIIVPLKVVRASRTILSLLSGFQYRLEIKTALNSNDFRVRKQVLSDIDFRTLALSTEHLKSIAFQLGQTIALIDGVETYTKRDISNYFEELMPF